MRGLPRAIVAAGLLAALGCAGSLPPTHYYVLRPADLGGSPAPAPAAGLRVGVQPFAVDPPYDQDRPVYRRGADSAEVGFYAYHRWAAPLDRLVAVALADGLVGTPGIAAIEPASATHAYDLLLGGRLAVLEEIEMAGASEGRARLELELRSPAGDLLWQDTAAGTSSGRVENGGDAVELLRAAFEQALGRARTAVAAGVREAS